MSDSQTRFSHKNTTPGPRHEHRQSRRERQRRQSEVSTATGSQEGECDDGLCVSYYRITYLGADRPASGAHRRPGGPPAHAPPTSSALRRKLSPADSAGQSPSAGALHTKAQPRAQDGKTHTHRQSRSERDRQRFTQKHHPGPAKGALHTSRRRKFAGFLFSVSLSRRRDVISCWFSKISLALPSLACNAPTAVGGTRHRPHAHAHATAHSLTEHAVAEAAAGRHLTCTWRVLAAASPGPGAIFEHRRGPYTLLLNLLGVLVGVL